MEESAHELELLKRALNTWHCSNTWHNYQEQGYAKIEARGFEFNGQPLKWAAPPFPPRKGDRIFLTLPHILTSSINESQNQLPQVWILAPCIVFILFPRIMYYVHTFPWHESFHDFHECLNFSCFPWIINHFMFSVNYESFTAFP